MNDAFERIKQFVWDNKEGAVVGGVFGWFVIVPLLTKDASSVQALQSVGVVDILKSASASATSFAVEKAKWFGVAIGVSVGVLIDSMLPEGFLGKWFK